MGVAIVVGHSLFFKHFFREYLCDNFKAQYGQLANDLVTKKLPNCGLAQLQLDPARRLVAGVELLPGTMMVGEEGCTKCCAAPTQANASTEIAIPAQSQGTP